MQVEIYADVVFFINLVMCFFILYVVSKVCRINVRKRRLLLASFVSTLMFCLMFFVPLLHKYINMLTTLIMLISGIWIAFSPKNIKSFVVLTASTTVTSFAVGGASIGLFYYTNISHLISNTISFTTNNFSVKILLASSCGFYILLKLFSNKVKSMLMSKQVFVQFEIEVAGKKEKILSLVDTGNTLCDPITGAPAIIVEFSSIKEMLPEKFKLLFYEKKENSLEEILESVTDTPFEGKIRMLPFKSVGEKGEC